jgi:hypothetical protein
VRYLAYPRYQSFGTSNVRMVTLIRVGRVAVRSALLE